MGRGGNGKSFLGQASSSIIYQDIFFTKEKWIFLLLEYSTTKVLDYKYDIPEMTWETPCVKSITTAKRRREYDYFGISVLVCPKETH